MPSDNEAIARLKFINHEPTRCASCLEFLEYTTVKKKLFIGCKKCNPYFIEVLELEE